MTESILCLGIFCAMALALFLSVFAAIRNKASAKFYHRKLIEYAAFTGVMLLEIRGLTHNLSANNGVIPFGLTGIYRELMSFVGSVRPSDLLAYSISNDIDVNELKLSDLRNTPRNAGAGEVFYDEANRIIELVKISIKAGNYEGNIPEEMRLALQEFVKKRDSGELKAREFFQLYGIIITTDTRQHGCGGIAQKIIQPGGQVEINAHWEKTTQPKANDGATDSH